MTDAETTAAVEALARRLRNNRDEDPDVFALEFITALRGRGWRPTEAKPAPTWKRPAGTGSKPPADVLAEARARCDEVTEAQHARAAERDGVT